MPRIDWLKVLKITLGCCLATALSLLLGLHYSTAAGVIALLSIQNTKKETLTIALKRLAACAAAFVAAYLSFSLLGYTIWGLGLYLLIFISFCDWQNLPETMAISTVLVAHFWVEQSLSGYWILNETGLLVIGVGTGILLNLFMPDQVQAIQKDQRAVEAAMREILESLSKALLEHPGEDRIIFQLEQLKNQIIQARDKALKQMNNTLLGDMRYYVQYLDMRNQQRPVLKRIYLLLGKLTYVPKQAKEIAILLEDAALTFHEYNNAVGLLQKVEQLRQSFKEERLPANREEFEMRAILFQILADMEHFLTIKRTFIENLNEEQQRLFWPDAGRL